MKTKETEIQYCSICGTTPADRAHLRSRGAGAGWKEHEWIYLCRCHHQQSHFIGWPRFLDLYPQLLQTIEAMGWKLIEMKGRRKLVYEPCKVD